MINIVVILILIALLALFSATETAYFSIRESELHLLKKQQVPHADLVLRLRADPHKLLVSILIANTVVNLMLGAYVTILAEHTLGSLGLGLAMGGMTLLVLAFGEVFPKSFAINHRRRVATFTARPISFFVYLLTPLSWFFVRFEHWIRIKTGNQPVNLISEEEIRIMTRLGLESGEIDLREHEMIENIFQFDDKQVGSIMTPYKKIIDLDGDVPVEQIAHFVSHTGFSRYPIVGDKGIYTGYIHLIDIMKALNSDRRDEPIQNFSTPLTTIPSTWSIEQVFLHMTKSRTHLYLVAHPDAPDTPVGLVTMEDLLEEIVGEIEDESDRDDNLK